MMIIKHQKQSITIWKEFNGGCSFGGNALKLFKEVKIWLAVFGEIAEACWIFELNLEI